MYLIRLDDASEYMDIEKWNRIEQILDKYDIKPIVGVIPNNKDEDLVCKYKKDLKFWNKARAWQTKGWKIALHGYTHKYLSNSGGINPVNMRSEFAGVDLKIQKQKIRDGLKVFNSQNINTKIFFAPAHTFDMNTLEALKTESDIRIISDTIANDTYKNNQFYFIPQQAGYVRRLPFKIATFCYHPNNMSNYDFQHLENFINKNRKKFIKFSDIKFYNKGLSLYSKLLRLSYFWIKKLKSKL